MEFDGMVFPIGSSGMRGIGLSKREYFAAMFMQAMISADNETNKPWEFAHMAVSNANALLEVLEAIADEEAGG